MIGHLDAPRARRSARADVLAVLLVLCTALWSSTLFGVLDAGSAHALTIGGSTVSARRVSSIVGPRGDASRPPGPNLRSSAVALDAVTWATKSPSAPATMTVDQLRDVFACRVTNWAQLPGGREGAIRRVMPPSWSGTAITFIRLLGGSSPSTMSRPADPNAYGPLDRGCPAVRTMQENAPTDRVLGSATIAAQAILPYSAGTWAWQASHATRRSHNGRGGIRLGAVSTGGVALHPLRQDGAGIGLDPAVVREPGTAPAGATVFPGAYSLYTGVSVRSPGYGAIGSGGRCQGEHRDDILGGGFLPLEPGERLVVDVPARGAGAAGARGHPTARGDDAHHYDDRACRYAAADDHRRTHDDAPGGHHDGPRTDRAAPTCCRPGDAARTARRTAPVRGQLVVEHPEGSHRVRAGGRRHPSAPPLRAQQRARSATRSTGRSRPTR